MFVDKPPDKRIVLLGDRVSRRGRGVPDVIFQPLACSHGVLAHGRVCKPFAHERWLIRHERWPKASCLRTERWPISARVCKPERSCSQAATPTHWRKGRTWMF